MFIEFNICTEMKNLEKNKKFVDLLKSMEFMS
jgi:hypothetical protein